MSFDTIWSLDLETLELFASKGKEGGPGIPQVCNPNGVKVRRVMQIIRDLAKRPVNELRVLDLACGEGVYAIETALLESEILAIDARTERMDKGAEAARRLGLTKVSFEKNDVRHITIASKGKFDVIFFLGILYHLDVPDAFHVLENLYEMCQEFIIIDTHICLIPESEAQYKGRTYKGVKAREHGDNDPGSIRKSRLLMSIDNTFSFHFTKESLIQLLGDVGFTSVFECHVPMEPFKPSDRITLVANKGTQVKISSYPWVNDKTEDEIKAFLKVEQHAETQKARQKQHGIKHYVKSAVNSMLQPLGYEIRRI